MTPTKTRPHKPMLAEWSSEILSLSLSLSQQAKCRPSAYMAAMLARERLSQMHLLGDYRLRALDLPAPKQRLIEGLIEGLPFAKAENHSFSSQSTLNMRGRDLMVHIAQLMQMPESNIVIFSRIISPLLESF